MFKFASKHVSQPKCFHQHHARVSHIRQEITTVLAHKTGNHYGPNIHSSLQVPRTFSTESSVCPTPQALYATWEHVGHLERDMSKMREMIENLRTPLYEAEKTKPHKRCKMLKDMEALQNKVEDISSDIAARRKYDSNKYLPGRVDENFNYQMYFASGVLVSLFLFSIRDLLWDSCGRRLFLNKPAGAACQQGDS
ncbi:unnamed protein product [Tuber aestivum]|uniref:Uncharacterized protein n=1 Tax=Tuber aestivum TaxID=59557 RepID=A0A292Q7S3_9PEZI|nr:unnamed protein product [Tuber aestivum]